MKRSFEALAAGMIAAALVFTVSAQEGGPATSAAPAAMEEELVFPEEAPGIDTLAPSATGTTEAVGLPSEEELLEELSGLGEPEPMIEEAPSAEAPAEVPAEEAAAEAAAEAAVAPEAEIEELLPAEPGEVAEAEAALAGEEAAAEVESELIELEVERDLGEGIEVMADEEKKDLITLSLDDVPLQDVIRMFTRISGANIVAGTNLQGNVTVSLQDVEWEPALRVILDSVDMGMVEKTPGIYSIMSKSALASEPVTVDTIFLNYTTVSNVLPIVQKMLVTTNASASGFPAANAVVVQETATHLAKIKTTIASLDVPRPQVYIEAKFVELNDEAIKDLGINWQALQAYNIGARGLQLDYEEDRQWTDRRRDTMERWDTRSQLDTVDRVYDMYGVEYQDETVTYEQRPGTDPPVYDIAREVEPTRTFQDAIDLGQDIRRETEDTFEKVVTDIRTAVLTADDFQLTLSALKQNNGAEVVSNPRIIVASGETATIHVGVKEPNIQAKPQGDTGNVYVYSLDDTERFFDIGVKLAVTPTVNTAERITVRIKPELSSLGIPVQVPQAGIEFPRINTRVVNTEFNLASGRTVAIGGLIRTGDVEEISKLPVLGDIPLVGKYLFRHTHTEKRQDEVIIFVTVGLADPEFLGDVSGIPSEGRLIHRHLILRKNAEHQL